MRSWLKRNDGVRAADDGQGGGSRQKQNRTIGCINDRITRFRPNLSLGTNVRNAEHILQSRVRPEH